MTLEQRIEALEKTVASLTLPSAKSEELAKMMRDMAVEIIKDSQRPGGAFYRNEGKATDNKVALLKVNSESVFIQPARIDEACLGRCHK